MNDVAHASRTAQNTCCCGWSLHQYGEALRCSSWGQYSHHVVLVSLQDYFCFKCFEDMHRRGNRLQHKSMLVSVSAPDSEDIAVASANSNSPSKASRVQVCMLPSRHECLSEMYGA